MPARRDRRIGKDSTRDGLSEGLLLPLIDALPLLVAYVDLDECYRLNNNAYEDWFGQPCEQLLGRHVREIIGDGAYQIIKPHLQAALSGKSVTFEQNIAFKHAGSRTVEIPGYH